MKSDTLKSYIFVATTAIGVTMYVHSTFARLVLVKSIERKIEKEINLREVQSERTRNILCKIAIKLNAAEDICVR